MRAATRTSSAAGSLPLTVESALSYYLARPELTTDRTDRGEQSRHPKVSILVLTYNNLPVSQLCLRSIYCNTTYPNYEVVVVDNASSDGTADWLERHAHSHTNLNVVRNPQNAGFASGNNRAAREASGEYLVFLNNDTIATAGWIEGLLRHFEVDPRIGILGPVTNDIGNEARIQVDYTTPAQMEVFAAKRGKEYAGQELDIRMLAFFCVMVPKALFLELGGLDERFGMGMFEDDDFAVRVHQAGWRVVCAEDVFIHHFHGATFGKLDNRYTANLFEENRRKYEEKWGKTWEPYKFREEITSFDRRERS